ncbi:2-oxo-4-hydroxy-4-carboxy-5-ureidoimidazoline decarboxylase [Bacillus marasmi]|uniref:2-oxo-4-hydroxy-4-carboxy-5-ureidoimidazoline decarboxylase n=1 Tax=Bacillus marasmi TaxID=1926279 RepID=UPI0011C73A89|nr:2-oxo-4-hydroxy-4-carboxy-5-ureidoimidazoline decarboxylase [Bacillus marasmi]
MLTIEKLNLMSTNEFTDVIGDIFEESAWIAAAAALERPFASVDDLHQSMVAIIQRTSRTIQLNLLEAHPNLGEKIAMSHASSKEQRAAGLTNLTSKEYETFLSLNTRYHQKFGFPLIIAVRGKDKKIILADMTKRLHNDASLEFQIALAEVFKIAWFRLNDKIKQ